MPSSGAPCQERPQISFVQADSAVERARLQQTHRKKGKGSRRRSRHRHLIENCEIPLFTELCSQEHPGTRAMRNQERSELRLLQMLNDIFCPSEPVRTAYQYALDSFRRLQKPFLSQKKFRPAPFLVYHHHKLFVSAHDQTDFLV